jgi:hypothetical protein
MVVQRLRSRAGKCIVVLLATSLAATLLYLWQRTRSELEAAADILPESTAVAVAVLGRHAAAVGDVVAAGDFVCETVFEGPGEKYKVTSYVRRSPFGYRRETRPERGQGLIVELSDGRYAWEIDKDGNGKLLVGERARLLLEAAWIEGLQYLVAGPREQMPTMMPPQQIAALPTVPLVPVPKNPLRPIDVKSPSGMKVRLYIDEASGVLHGSANPTIVPLRNVRHANHQLFGTLRLPALRVENRAARLGEQVRVVSVRFGPLAPELFGSVPRPPLTPWIDASPLEVRHAAWPGSACFLLPEVRANGRSLGPALFDTGASYTCLDESLATQLGLQVLSPRSNAGMSGKVTGARRWLDSLELPGFTLTQLDCGSAALPYVAAAANGQSSRLVVANELLSMSPVVDLRQRRLLLRSNPVQPLDGKDCIRLPLERRIYRDLDTVPIAIDGKRLDVVLDTGLETALRLTPRGLARAGLPTDPAYWEARTSIRREIAGIGMQGRQVPFVWLPSFTLGPVQFRPSLVILDFTQILGEHDEGSLGAGALAGFARIGLDRQRRLLELEPGPGLRREGGGYVAAPAASVFGMCLREPDAAALARGDNQPVIYAVMPGTPWVKAGVTAGDRLLRIDGQPCDGRELGALAVHEAGPAKQVLVEIGKPGGEVLQLPVQRK